MNRRIYWGVGLLILLIGVGAFVFYSQYSELQQLKQDAAEAEKLLEEKNKPEVVVDAQRQPPPDASPHGHWHGDEWHDEPHTPVAQDVPDKQTYTGPLTFHKELLETNPVKALRLQAEERGHWSAKWIPPFPPDDTEAAAIAKNIYLLLYYESIGKKDTPEWKKAHEAHWDNLRMLEDMPFGERVCDLMMLLYYDVEEDSVLPFYTPGHRFDESGIRHEDRIRRLPSNYFPLYFSDIK